MNENSNERIDKIGNSIISYLDFLKKFQIKENDVIIKDEKKENSKIYTFCNFSINCFIIDKQSLDNFKKSTNFEKRTNKLFRKESICPRWSKS